MARDYKNSSSTRKSGGGSGSGRPLLTGIVIGLILGLGISVGVAVYLKGAPSPFVDVSKRHEDQSQAASAAQASATQADKPKFDFYTILPGSEETLDEKASAKAASATAAAASSKNTYFLQAGAYQDENQADNLKAKLALLGVEAIIQTAQVGDKGIWHRVRIGPYKSLDDLSQVRANLQQQGIETSIIKVSEAKP